MFRPVLEALENRLNPAPITYSNRLITVQGDGDSNDVMIEVTPMDRVVITIDNYAAVYNLSSIKRIDVNLSSGSDRFIYMNGNDDYLPRDDSRLTLNVYGNAGDDIVLVGGGGSARFNAMGGPGDDILLAEDAVTGVTLKGGDGDDLLIGGYGNDFLFGGAGDDSIMDGDGTDTINGGTGADNLLSDEGSYNFADVVYYDANDMLVRDPADLLYLV